MGRVMREGQQQVGVVEEARMLVELLVAQEALVEDLMVAELEVQQEVWGLLEAVAEVAVQEELVVEVEGEEMHLQGAPEQPELPVQVGLPVVVLPVVEVIVKLVERVELELPEWQDQAFPQPLPVGSLWVAVEEAEEVVVVVAEGLVLAGLVMLVVLVVLVERVEPEVELLFFIRQRQLLIPLQ